MNGTVVITGAFSYTGRYTTRLLLERGHRVRTLTNHPPTKKSPPSRKKSEKAGTTPASPHPFDELRSLRAGSVAESATRVGQPCTDPFGGRVEAFPYNFHRPEELRRTLEGASALINTYWVRFPHGKASFDSAVKNSRILIDAARGAGVRRIVHVSIANPSLESTLGYYRGKALVEQAIEQSGLSYAILRPTVIFGAEDILINNIAWFVRWLPVFGVPGSGEYGVRPIYVGDMARLLADAVAGSGNNVANAVGPETFRFEELVRLIGKAMKRRVRLVHVPKFAAYLATLVTGWVVRDVVLTWEEYGGLMGNLLAPEGASVGETRLSEWLGQNAAHIGTRYASEVARHF
jgi:NADH dehydrogenase